jgi:hypothetical protein
MYLEASDIGISVTKCGPARPYYWELGYFSGLDISLVVQELLRFKFGMVVAVDGTTDIVFLYSAS